MLTVTIGIRDAERVRAALETAVLCFSFPSAKAAVSTKDFVSVAVEQCPVRLCGVVVILHLHFHGRVTTTTSGSRWGTGWSWGWACWSSRSWGRGRRGGSCAAIFRPLREHPVDLVR